MTVFFWCSWHKREQLMRGVLAFALALIAATAAAQDRIPIVASTTDPRALVEAVGGERVAVASIAPATIDAEDYVPKPQDVARVAAARLAGRGGPDRSEEDTS